MASGEHLAAPIDDHHVHLASILGHIGEGDDSQPGEETSNVRSIAIIHCNVVIRNTTHPICMPRTIKKYTTCFPRVLWCLAPDLSFPRMAARSISV